MSTEAAIAADVACWGCGRLIPTGYRLCVACVRSDDKYAAFADAHNVDWVGTFCDRYDELTLDARNVDDDWGHLGLSLATDAVNAVEELFPSYDDDEPFMRFACLLWAMQRALDEARDEYREVRPHPRSGWSAEAFPKAVLGLS